MSARTRAADVWLRKTMRQVVTFPYMEGLHYLYREGRTNGPRALNKETGGRLDISGDVSGGEGGRIDGMGGQSDKSGRVG